MAITSIFNIIINGFNYWQKLSPVILLFMNKNLKFDFYCTILSLDLVFNLRIKYNRKFLLNIKIIVLQRLELWGKQIILMSDY